MKTKLFIYGHWMQIDGVSASLIGLLNGFDYAKVSVDLMLRSCEGPFRKLIPKEVNLLPECSVKKRGALSSKFVWKTSLIIAGVYYKLLRRMRIDPYGLDLIQGLVWGLFLPKYITPGEYDKALFFSCDPSLCKRVRAKKTFVWVHTDWGRFHPIKWMINVLFARADYIVNVSEAAKRSFDMYLKKKYLGRSVVIENLLSREIMMQRSDAFVVPDVTKIKILSVGRISPPKNYMRALQAAKILKDKGLSFKWYIVGGGEGEVSLRTMVKEMDVGDCVEMTGMVENPYPYYRWADLYVCTSDWEGKSVSVREAQAFGLPTVITRFPTSSAQLEDGVDGIIAELTPESVAEKVMMLSDNGYMREGLRSTCLSRDYTNRREIDKILSL